MDSASMNKIIDSFEEAENSCLITFKDDTFNVFGTFDRPDQLINFLLMAAETLLFNVQEEERQSLTDFAQTETKKLLKRIDKKLN